MAVWQCAKNVKKKHKQEDCKEQNILQLGVAVNFVQDFGCSLPSVADLSVPVGPNSKSNVSSLAMRGALVGLAGAVKDMPRGPAGSPPPTERVLLFFLLALLTVFGDDLRS